MMKKIDLDENLFTESMITLGGKAYPHYGQVLILAGGAGSGKTFQLKNIIGIDGKVLDVDKFKDLAIHNSVVQGIIKRRCGVDLTNKALNLSNPDDVTYLHQIIKDSHLEDIWWKNRESTKTFENKPNLIFDKTLKNFADLVTLRDAVVGLGYKLENIHVVWILNRIESAIEQNKNRDRKIDENILIATHIGVSTTIRQMVKLGDVINQYVGGDIWISFNQKDVDVVSHKMDNGGLMIDDIFALKVKEQGKEVDIDMFNKAVLSKIVEYTKDIGWSTF